MDSLEGRVAIVTGASRGIGAAIARRFAGEGARVAVTARTTEAGQSPYEGTIHETVQSILDAGGVAVPIAASLARAEDRARLVAETERQLGPVDVLVVNDHGLVDEEDETDREEDDHGQDDHGRESSALGGRRPCEDRDDEPQDQDHGPPDLCVPVCHVRSVTPDVRLDADG